MRMVLMAAETVPTSREKKRSRKRRMRPLQISGPTLEDYCPVAIMMSARMNDRRRRRKGSAEHRITKSQPQTLRFGTDSTLVYSKATSSLQKQNTKHGRK